MVVSDQPQPGLAIRGEENKGSHTLRLTGELDLVSAGLLETRIAELCTDGASRIVLEMTELSFMDSTGLRSLLVSQELCSVNSCRAAGRPAEPAGRPAAGALRPRGTPAANARSELSAVPRRTGLKWMAVSSTARS